MLVGTCQQGVVTLAGKLMIPMVFDTASLSFKVQDFTTKLLGTLKEFMTGLCHYSSYRLNMSHYQHVEISLVIKNPF